MRYVQDFVLKEQKNRLSNLSRAAARIGYGKLTVVHHFCIYKPTVHLE